MNFVEWWWISKNSDKSAINDKKLYTDLISFGFKIIKTFFSIRLNRNFWLLINSFNRYRSSVFGLPLEFRGSNSKYLLDNKIGIYVKKIGTSPFKKTLKLQVYKSLKLNFRTLVKLNKLLKMNKSTGRIISVILYIVLVIQILKIYLYYIY